MKQNIFPELWYRDPKAAIAWLERAFGFKPYLVVPGDDGGVAHAELMFEGGLIMLGHADGGEFRMTSPRDLPGVNQGVCVTVADVDTHYAQALSAGAEIVRPIHDTQWSRQYGARDLEGHVWNFSNYRPGEETPTT